MRPHPSIVRGSAVRSAFGALLIVLWLSSNALAWNKPGHMVTACIAFDALRVHDKGVINRAAELLRAHRFFESHWKDEIRTMSAEDQVRVVFMRAAAWPDDVRMDPRYHHGAWHYINFPYVPKDQPNDIRGREPDPTNILSALGTNVEVVQDKRRTGEERAIALAWIFHLTGDVHQPLHTVSLFTTQWPDGDRGGNGFYVRAKAENQPINLHRFWDDLIVGSDRLQSIRNVSIQIRKTFPRDKLDELKDREFRAWAKESYDLAVSHAYEHGTLPGSADKSGTPVLTQSYRLSAKAFAERRAALAGYRLADVLKRLFD